MNKHGHCLCLQSLAAKLNFNISKVVYCGLRVLYVPKYGATLLAGVWSPEKTEQLLE